VTWKRVAARQRPAEEFGLGSVSVHLSSAQGLKPEEVGAKSFLAHRRPIWKWFLACSNSGCKSFSLLDAQAGSAFLPVATQAARVFSLIDAQGGRSFSPADTQAGSGFSRCGSSSWKGFLAYTTQAARVFSPMDARAQVGSRKQTCKLRAASCPQKSEQKPSSNKPRARDGATRHRRHSRTTARKLLASISPGLSPSEPEKPHRN